MDRRLVSFSDAVILPGWCMKSHLLCTPVHSGEVNLLAYSDCYQHEKNLTIALVAKHSGMGRIHNGSYSCSLYTGQ